MHYPSRNPPNKILIISLKEVIIDVDKVLAARIFIVYNSEVLKIP